MGWEVNTAQPTIASAIYYLVMPNDNEVFHAFDLEHSPALFSGDFNSFIRTQPYGTPLIPMDTHHALLLKWVDIDDMTRNRPYLNDAVKAAVALVA